MADKSTLDVLDPVNSSWDEAIASVRNSAKWLVIATGAAATFIFGAGTLGARQDLGKAVGSGTFALAVLLGILSLVFLALLAWDVGQVFRPASAALHDLTPATRTVLQRTWRVNPGAWATTPPGATGSDAAPCDPGQELINLIAQHKSDIDALEQALVNAETLAGTQGKATRHALTTAKNLASSRLASLVATAQATLDMERYERVKASRAIQSETYVFATLALVFALGYQLALSAASSPAPPASSAGGDPAAQQARVVGYLGPAATEQGAQVWSQSGLENCTGRGSASMARPPESTPVPVVITGGRGSADDPFLVQTIPALGAGACPALAITVTDDYFLLTTTPTELVVTATPTAEATQ